MGRCKPSRHDQWRRVIPRKKYLITKRPSRMLLRSNLLGFSYLLLLIWIMKYGKWMSRQCSLMEVLMRPFIWSNQKDSLKKAKKRKCASYKNPFMNLSRHYGLGTSNLTSRSNHLDLSNVLMSLVCIRGAAKMWWCFSYFMQMISSSLETTWGHYLQLKYGCQISLI